MSMLGPPPRKRTKFSQASYPLEQYEETSSKPTQEYIEILKEREALMRAKYDHIYRLPLDISDILLMAFEARKYLTKFGENWERIAEFISLDLRFSGKRLSAAMVEQVYNFVKEFTNEEEIEIMRKQNDFNRQGEGDYEVKMEEEEGVDDPPPFDFDTYEQQLKEPCQPKFNKFKEQYQNFTEHVLERMREESVPLPRRENRIYETIKEALRRFSGPRRKKIHVAPGSYLSQPPCSIEQAIKLISERGEYDEMKSTSLSINWKERADFKQLIDRVKELRDNESSHLSKLKSRIKIN